MPVRGRRWQGEAEPGSKAERSNSDLIPQLSQNSFSHPQSDWPLIAPAPRNRTLRRTAVPRELQWIDLQSPSGRRSQPARVAHEGKDREYHPVGLSRFHLRIYLLV